MKDRKSSARGFRVASVERLIAEAFESDLLLSLQDPLLEDLHVVRVEASRNLATVCVVVAPGTDEPARDPDAVRQALDRCRVWLRGQLSDRVRLKRVPALQLRYLPLPIWERQGGGA